MKKYLIGLFLVLFVVGCQQQATPTAPEPIGQVVADEPGTPTTEEKTTEGVKEETKEEASEGADVRILGKEGFDPEELTVSKDATVVFRNNADKLLTLNVWEGRRVIDTFIVQDGKVGEVTFDKAGSFEVRTLEYATSISITVE